MIESQGFASVGRRFIALLIDVLVMSIPFVLINQILPIVGGIALWFFYGPVFECSELRATPGKYWMGIQVVDIQGRRLSFQASLLRNVVKLFSSAFFCLGYSFALFTKKRQSLHDLAADTTVVYGRSDGSASSFWANSARSVFSSRIFVREDSLSKLERLQSLREKGGLSEDEFQTAKKKILGDGGL